MGGRTLAVLLLASVGCSRGPSRQMPEDLATTDGLLARSNLEAMIGGRERMLARDPSSGAVRLTLVTLLQARSSTYGRLEDLDRAEEIANEGVARSPRSPDAWLARASIRAHLHRFREASGDLDRAVALGSAEEAVSAQRASIALARGDLAGGLRLARARAAREPDMATLSALGVALAESGEGVGARAAFARALASYRDTSPFPVAFIDFQQGLLAERAGDLSGAAERYRAVLRRLPGHAQAAVHLASLELALGHPDAAAEALGTVLPEASDPEILTARAWLARAGGDLAAAERNESAARGRYLELLGGHPEAFADHAARFLLPREPALALRWALHNLEVRSTPEAFDLALSAALQAGDARAGCAVVRRGEALGARTPRLEALLVRAGQACGSAAPVVATGPRR